MCSSVRGFTLPDSSGSRLEQTRLLGGKTNLLDLDFSRA